VVSVGGVCGVDAGSCPSRRKGTQSCKEVEEDRERERERERERDFTRVGEEGEKKEGQSGSGNDRPSALEANIDECPALLALRNRGERGIALFLLRLRRSFLSSRRCHGEPRAIGPKTATACANSKHVQSAYDDI